MLAKLAEHRAKGHWSTVHSQVLLDGLRAELRRQMSQMSWLSDEAEALGQVRSEDGATLALNWTQVLAAITELRAELAATQRTVSAYRREVQSMGPELESLREANATIADLRAECRRLTAKWTRDTSEITIASIEALRADLANANSARDEARQTALAANVVGAWAWMPNAAENCLESMSDGMVVSITAGTLRGLLAEANAANEALHNKLRTSEAIEATLISERRRSEATIADLRIGLGNAEELYQRALDTVVELRADLANANAALKDAGGYGYGDSAPAEVEPSPVSEAKPAADESEPPIVPCPDCGSLKGDCNAGYLDTPIEPEPEPTPKHADHRDNMTIGGKPVPREPEPRRYVTQSNVAIFGEAQPAADESEPPPGWRISETRTGDWWGIGVHDPMERTYTFPRERTYTFHTYEEAVAACWAAYRAQQPATVTAPEPTLEAQIDAAYMAYVNTANRLREAIAARNRKAGAK
jgi:hypothetical protein